MLSAIGDAVKGKASTLGNAALANMEDARGIALSAKDLAGEASSLVKVRGDGCRGAGGLAAVALAFGGRGGGALGAYCISCALGFVQL